MAKAKTAFVCSECGAEHPRWQGQCQECKQWNTLSEIVLQPAKSARSARYEGYAGTTSAKVLKMAEVPLETVPRIVTGMSEMDRVFGGGLVPGGIALLGGDPGIGKSTILLQMACHLSTPERKILIVTGEESAQQVAERAKRLELPHQDVLILAETEVDRILAIAGQEKPHVMVIDSIQTMHMANIESAPGSVSQVRESAATLTRFAKQTNTSVILVGHVTKDGSVAGPRVLEHIVDSVIFIEGRTDSRFRVMRALKNRFGAVNELGVFAMTETGMKEVKNPSAIFLSRMEEPAPGSAVMVIWEGSRPLLVEIQALMDESHGPNPRRVTVGMEQNRLAMLLAVLHRHGGIPVHDQDVFINVVGGVRVTETSADLALLMAVISSLKDKPLPQDLVVFGEVGLAGEIRPVNSGPERLKEAAKHGFKRAIVPKSNIPKDGIPGMKIIGVNRLSEALAASRDL